MTTTLSTFDIAAQYVAARPTFWTGPSGEQVTGEQTAHHLDAVHDLLQRDGWVRNFRTDDPDIELPDETASVKTMIRQLFRVIRDIVGTDKRNTLHLAIHHVAKSNDGDDDTGETAINVLHAILQARTGADTALVGAWASKLGRTWEEVAELLTEAAKFARTYGPAS
ncbi:hypothetical protein TPA0910_87570 [Streptomyces hygroscopicus subsp. sporocinereus]|uniref:Uncharacterized protein n=1 Tax=Streptomyces hygroscopicus TaxID=1912 RepID=A0ABQ3UFE8_STRHY|nr:hypothetical protein [Streptomyces hygroscopicus]GHJ34324.1 hypothetical protein TPA0910_87570 [Streptomyces hygroscopicus]